MNENARDVLAEAIIDATDRKHGNVWITSYGVANAALAALDAAGFAVAPKEPTDAMRTAGLMMLCSLIEKEQSWWREECGGDDMPISGLMCRSSAETDAVYRAMVEAAQKP